jgi:hypothetical protein
MGIEGGTYAFVDCHTLRCIHSQHMAADISATSRVDAVTASIGAK